MNSKEQVNHPEHYNQGNIECIDAMLSAYGEWGSVIVNEEGTVIHNADYGAAIKLLHMPSK